MTANELRNGVVSVATDRIADTLSDLNSYMRKLNEMGVVFYRNATRYDFADAQSEMIEAIRFLDALKERVEDGSNALKKSVDAWNSIID